jgi:hypothetical protein
VGIGEEELREPAVRAVLEQSEGLDLPAEQPRLVS